MEHTVLLQRPASTGINTEAVKSVPSSACCLVANNTYSLLHVFMLMLLLLAEGWGFSERFYPAKFQCVWMSHTWLGSWYLGSNVCHPHYMNKGRHTIPLKKEEERTFQHRHSPEATLAQKRFTSEIQNNYFEHDTIMLNIQKLIHISTVQRNSNAGACVFIKVVNDKGQRETFRP